MSSGSSGYDHTERSEAAEYYFTYIDLVRDDILEAMRTQSDQMRAELAAISEERSLRALRAG